MRITRHPLHNLGTTAILLALATLPAWLGCGPAGDGGDGTAGPASPVIDRIVASGKLRVGMTGEQPPLNMTNRGGEIMGLEADLARALAGSMGVDLVMVKKEFPQLLGAVEDGSIDVALSGMAMTSERNLRVAFVGPYYISGKSLITRSASLALTRSAADLRDLAIPLAALAESTSLALIENELVKATPVPVSSYDEGIQKIITGEVQAMVADFPVCLIATFQYPEAGLQEVVAPFSFEPLGAAVPAGDPLFVNLVQNFLNAFEESGAMDTVKDRWFEDGAWLDTLETGHENWAF